MRRSRPLRVCMLATYDLAPEGGGVNQHAVHLAAALRRLGDEVTILGPASGPVDRPHVHALRGVVNIPANGSDNYLGIFVSPQAVRRFFREREFDVIHVHEPLNPTLPYWATWMTRKVPHVATFHAFIEEESPAKLWARKLWSKTLEPWFQRSIAVSEPAAVTAAAAWSRPLTIIPNGVPTRIFRPLPHRNGAGPLKLLFVGRLADDRKGVRYLIEAYARLRAQGAQVTLDLVGDLGSTAPPPALPGLTCHGPVSVAELVLHYRASDALVAPSTGQESFGIVLLEAMSSAKPIVCSDIEGYRRVVDRRGALLVQPRDAAALESALARFAALGPEERQRMADANLAHVQQFDWDAVAPRVRGEYLAAMGFATEPVERTEPLEPAFAEEGPLSAAGMRMRRAGGLGASALE